MSLALFERDAVRDRPADVRAYVSPSRLNLWLRCPLASKLKYVNGIREHTTPALFVGKAVHSLLVAGALLPAPAPGRGGHGRVPGPPAARTWDELVDAESMIFESVTDVQACQRQAVDLVAAYLYAVPAEEPKSLAVEVSVDPARRSGHGRGPRDPAARHHGLVSARPAR